MRRFLYATLELFQEQWSMMKLTKAQASCRTRGHELETLIIWKEQFELVCPRCGASR